MLEDDDTHLLLGSDDDVLSFHPHIVTGQAVQTWEVFNVSCLCVEAGSVPGAADSTISQAALCKRCSIVCAFVTQGREVAVLAHQESQSFSHCHLPHPEGEGEMEEENEEVDEEEEGEEEEEQEEKKEEKEEEGEEEQEEEDC